MRTARHRVALTVEILIIFATCANCAFGKGCSSGSQVLLTYSEQGPPTPVHVSICSPQGKMFVVSFDPFPDVEDHIAVLDLVLNPPSGRGKNVNLLAVDRPLHGYQLFNFGAGDYVDGAKDSTYGEERTIEISNMKAKLVVDVVDVDVAKKKRDLGNPDEWFRKLTLKISMKEGSQSPVAK